MVFLQLEIDEGIPAPELQARVVCALMAECRKFPLRHARAADRACPVCRIENDPISEGQDLLQGIVEKACHFALAIRIEVRATDVADE